jgi:hypothetical protein
MGQSDDNNYMTELIKCSQCNNLFDNEELIEQDFDGHKLKICLQCIEEIMYGERVILI